jgi:DNA-binding transcriptional LysR family regulator
LPGPEFGSKAFLQPQTHACILFSAKRRINIVQTHSVHTGSVEWIVLPAWAPSVEIGSFAAALEGFGIAFIAEDLAREGLRSGRLIKALPDYETPSRPIHLMYHPDRRQTPKLKSFIDAVVSQLSP